MQGIEPRKFVRDSNNRDACHRNTEPQELSMLNLTQTQRSQLATSADNAGSDALDGTLTGWRAKAPRNEPDAVTAVVSAGMPATAPGWTSVLNPLGYTVQLIGVFCHQTPKVDFLNAAGAA